MKAGAPDLVEIVRNVEHGLRDGFDTLPTAAFLQPQAPEVAALLGTVLDLYARGENAAAYLALIGGDERRARRHDRNNFALGAKDTTTKVARSGLPRSKPLPLVAPRFAPAEGWQWDVDRRTMLARNPPLYPTGAVVAVAWKQDGTIRREALLYFEGRSDGPGQWRIGGLKNCELAELRTMTVLTRSLAALGVGLDADAVQLQALRPHPTLVRTLERTKSLEHTETLEREKSIEKTKSVERTKSKGRGR